MTKEQADYVIGFVSNAVIRTADEARRKANCLLILADEIDPPKEPPKDE